MSDLNKPEEFLVLLTTLQEEISTLIKKHYPIPADAQDVERRNLHKALGTVLLAIGMVNLKDSGSNPIKFLEEFVQQAKVMIAVETIFGGIVDAPIPRSGEVNGTN